MPQVAPVQPTRGGGSRANTTVAANVLAAGMGSALTRAYRSGRLPLPIKAMVQYYKGTAWVNSLTDSASAFDTSLSTAGGNMDVSVLSGLGGGVTIANPATAAVAVAVAGSVCSFNPAAPLAAGSANFSHNAPLYLPSTTSRATLGIFRGSLVYQRESY